ncbi:MAG TPA: hypothetical protein VNU66_06930, partial [Mycobacteriales bacterium]|nr:hypothetical protein [Mycobacteriales bacterium]
MNRAPLWRALVALLVVGLTGFFAFTQDPRLGLDLRGGTQIVLETRDSPTAEADAEATDRALEVLRRRVDALGVAEPTLARSGTNRIIVELPGVDDPQAAEEAVGRTAQLTFHPVLGLGDPALLPPEQQDDVQTPLTPATPVPEVPAEESPAPAETPPASEPAPAESPAASGVVDLPPVEPVAFTQTDTGATPTPSPSASPAAEDEGGGLGDERPFDPTLESQVLLSDQGDVISVGPAALTGEGVADAAVVTDQSGIGRSVSIDFRGDGGRSWEQITAEAACQPSGDPRRRIAIVLDGEVISSPQVQESVGCGIGIQGGTTQITGNFSQEEANNLAVLVKGGALPVPVETISRSFVGPTLGEDAIDASIKAGIIGLSLTGLFLIVVYRLAGFLATLALASYGVISYGALVALGATLTLPGLGGLLLSAG